MDNKLISRAGHFFSFRVRERKRESILQMPDAIVQKQRQFNTKDRRHEFSRLPVGEKDADAKSEKRRVSSSVRTVVQAISR